MVTSEIFSVFWKYFSQFFFGKQSEITDWKGISIRKIKEYEKNYNNNVCVSFLLGFI
jgi:hypothetical protein